MNTNDHPTPPRIPRAVVILGIVSLFTDLSSEMLYPVAPLYLTGVLGASMVLLGVLEGVAEGIGGFLKGYFGSVSDRTGSRAPFVRFGYSLSALSKPLPGVWGTVAGVVTGRVADRFGKGIRSAPRDALLSGYARKGEQGRVFGFHRAMDTAGAVVGPVVALIFLAYYPGQFQTLFLLAFIPSVIAAASTFFVADARFEPHPEKRYSPFSVFAYWKEAPREYRRMVIGLTLFAVVNSSDVFLILKARASGFSDAAAIGGYVLYNTVFALGAYPLGVLSDKLGKKSVLTGGLAVFAVVYLGFAFLTDAWQAWPLFAVYGVYAAATEGVGKAWIAELVPNEKRGTAIGLQTMLASFGTLVASSAAGFLWQYVDRRAPFLLATVGALGAFFLLVGIRPSKQE